MKQYTYHHSLSEEAIEGLRKMIGLEIHMLHSFGGKYYSSSINKNLVMGISTDTDYSITFRNKQNQYFQWKIISNILGDSWIGYDTYGLEMECVQHQVSDSAWMNTLTKADTDKSALSFTLNEHLKCIDIYGIKKKATRIENGKMLAKVDANLDMLVVFNTVKDKKLTFSGRLRGSGIAMKLYPASAKSDFDLWINNRENQWDEHLFETKRRIE